MVQKVNVSINDQTPLPWNFFDRQPRSDAPLEYRIENTESQSSLDYEQRQRGLGNAMQILREAAQDQVLSEEASQRFEEILVNQSARPKVPLRQLPMRSE